MTIEDLIKKMIIAAIRQDIIHPSWTFSLPYLQEADSNLRDSKTPKITFRKRPLPVNNPLTHTNELTELMANLRIISVTSKLLVFFFDIILYFT